MSALLDVISSCRRSGTVSGEISMLVGSSATDEMALYGE
jgi:hypothetical protein